MFQSKVTLFSYCHEDFQTVSDVAEYLTGAGVKVWMDKSSLQPGKPWAPEFPKLARSARSALVFFSEHACGKRERVFFSELATLKQEQRRRSDLRLIPVRLTALDFGRLFEPGDDLNFWRAIHCLDLHGELAESNAHKLLTLLGATKAASKVQFGASISISRVDSDPTPVTILIDGKAVASIGHKETKTLKPRPGRLELKFDCYEEKTSVYAGAGYAQTHYRFGHSDPVYIDISPFSSFAIILDAGSIANHSRNFDPVTSTLGWLAKKAIGYKRRHDPEKRSSWPLFSVRVIQERTR